MVGKKYKAGLIKAIFLCLVILKSACNLLQPKCNSTNAFKLLLEGRGKDDHDGVHIRHYADNVASKIPSTKLRVGEESHHAIHPEKKKQVWEEFSAICRN